MDSTVLYLDLRLGLNPIDKERSWSYLHDHENEGGSLVWAGRYPD